MTPFEARKEAKQKLAAVDRGEDPADQKARDRKALTVGQFCDEYLEAAKGRLKQSSLANDRGRIESHIRPLLGSKIVELLKPSDIERFMADVITGKSAAKVAKKKKKGVPVKGGTAAASRAVVCLHAILQPAVADGVIPKNPASKIKLPKNKLVFSRFLLIASVPWVKQYGALRPQNVVS
jgi:hypothetical protein